MSGHQLHGEVISLLLQDHLPLPWTQTIQANWSFCGTVILIRLVGLGAMASLNSKPSLKYFSDENEKYFMYSVEKDDVYSSFKISPDGSTYESRNRIAPFGDCSLDLGESKAGCIREKVADCRNPRTVFVSEYGYMSTGGENSYDLSLSDCRAKCMNNCFCVVYASAFDDKTGCRIWIQGSVFRANSNGRYIAHQAPREGK